MMKNDRTHPTLLINELFKLVRQVFNQHMKYYNKWNVSLSRGIFKMQYNVLEKVSCKIVNSFQPSSLILDIQLGSEYASAFNMTAEIYLLKVNKRNKLFLVFPLLTYKRYILNF